MILALFSFILLSLFVYAPVFCNQTTICHCIQTVLPNMACRCSIVSISTACFAPSCNSSLLLSLFVYAPVFCNQTTICHCIQTVLPNMACRCSIVSISTACFAPSCNSSLCCNITFSTIEFVHIVLFPSFFSPHTNPHCAKASNHHANLPLEMYSFTL